MANYQKLIKVLYSRIKEDDIPALGAQLTYYLILSFLPFLMFTINLISYTPLTNEDFLDNIRVYFPYETYDLIKDVVYKIVDSRNGGLLSFGAVASLWAASNGVNALAKGLNKAYDCDENRPFWKVRLMSALFTIALGLIILISLLFLVFGEVLWKGLYNTIGFVSVFKTIWYIIRLVVPFLTIIALLIALYLYMPNCRLSLKSVIPGAVISALAWIGISFVFSVYVNNFNNYSKTYGSLGGIFILLLWIYWSSIIILLGGELNALFASNFSEGSIISNSKNKAISLKNRNK